MPEVEGDHLGRAAGFEDKAPGEFWVWGIASDGVGGAVEEDLEDRSVEEEVEGEGAAGG